jgi:hypothetical protein|tara:strand:- start:75 stop:665 length:591 start_codon:yes stop_codon:yes gene_type:complete
MIVYLGMPKCASSWLWQKIRKNFEYHGLKEPHTLVEFGEKNNNIIDFSTNNWSMDSSTARRIDPSVSKYILIVRDPIELATSYYLQTKLEGESFDNFVLTLVKTKLICYGDIIQRWYNLVDKEKILIYNYNKDIEDNHQVFIRDICKKLSLESYDDTLPLQDKVFQTLNKPTLSCNNELMQIIKDQMSKFNQITQG